MIIERKVGEKRYVELSASPSNPLEVVVITIAKYKLKDCQDNVISEGNCEINGNRFKCFLDTSEKGRFHLEFTVLIGTETFKPDAVLVVE